MKKEDGQRDRIARALAFAHGAKIAYHQDGQSLTIAASRGYGSWGHSAERYAENHWREYTECAEATISILQERKRKMKMELKVENGNLIVRITEEACHIDDMLNVEYGDAEVCSGSIPISQLRDNAQQSVVSDESAQ